MHPTPHLWTRLGAQGHPGGSPHSSSKPVWHHWERWRPATPCLAGMLGLAPCPSGHRRRWAPQTPLAERGRKCQALVRFPSSVLAAEGTLATEGGRHPTGDTQWGHVPPQHQGAALGRAGASRSPDAHFAPCFPPRESPCMGAERGGVEFMQSSQLRGQERAVKEG